MNNQRGSFLVMTSMLVAILALLVIGVSQRGQLELRLVTYQLQLTHARLAALAGWQRTLELLEDDAHAAGGYDALNEPWASNPPAFEHQTVLPEQTFFTVAYETGTAPQTQTVYGAHDEQSRLNLNTATPEMMAALPGMDLDVARSIVAFRTATNTTDPALAQQIPSDRTYYQTLSPPYTTKGSAFESLAEVALVRGMTPERFAVVAACCTVYATDNGAVNLNTAPPDVVRALRIKHSTRGIVGLSEAFIAALGTYRRGNDRIAGTADDGVFQRVDDLLQLAQNPRWPGPVLQDDLDVLGALAAAQQVGVASTAARIRVEGRTADGTVAAVLETVVLRGADHRAARVVSWRWE